MLTQTICGDGLPIPRRHWSLVSIWLAMTMAVLDGVIMNVALPTLAHDLGVTPATSLWVINAYQIAIVMLLLPCAAAGDIFGYRRVYLAGVTVFAVASIGCMISSSPPTLTLWRLAQGMGAAAIMAVNGALIRFTFPSNQLGRGIGYNAVVVGIGSAAGPTIAAITLAVASWRWLFAINLPIGLVVIAVGLRALPADNRVLRAFDWHATVLNATAFGALFLTATATVNNSLSPSTLISLTLAVVAGGALWFRSRTQREPMVPIDLLSTPRLRSSYVASVTSFAGQMLGLLSLPFYLQSQYGSFGVGLLLSCLPIGMATGASLAGRWSDRIASESLGAIGMGIFAGSYLLLGPMHSGNVVGLIICLLVAGFGSGLFQAPNNRIMLGEAPRSRSGAAAGLMAVCRVVGQIVGALAAAFLFRLYGASSAIGLFVVAGVGVISAAASAMRPTTLSLKEHST